MSIFVEEERSNPTKYTTTFITVCVLAAVVSLSFALSSSLDSQHTNTYSDSSDYSAMYWLGFSAMTLTIFSRGVICVASRIWQGRDIELWKEGNERSMQPMDIAVMIVLFILTAVATAGIIRTLVFMALTISKCNSETDFGTTAIATAFCYNLASLVFFIVLLYLFFTKYRYEVSASKGSKKKVTAILVVSIFAVLFVGLEKFLDYINHTGLPLKRTANDACDTNDRYLKVEIRLRPFYVQLCVVLLFLLLAKVAKSSKTAGVLHFWSTTSLQKLNRLGGESNINFDSLRPLVKKFSCILLVAFAATLAWTAGAFLSAKQMGTNYYAITNIAEYILACVLCLLGFGILKKITNTAPKQGFDVFIAVGLIITSCFTVAHLFLSAYANFACLHRSNCSSVVENASSNIPLQIAQITSNLTAVSFQVVLAVSVRKLAKDLWSLKVHTPTEQERIHMDAKTSSYAFYVYPFIIAYMTFTNFARYLIDLALEGPDSSERTATALRAETVIYGRSVWEYTDRMLFSVASLFRLISFFVFLEETINLMLSTFTEYWLSKGNKNPNNLGDQEQNRGERRQLLVNRSV